MKKVIIDKAFLNPGFSLSGGLITGLKKLVSRGIIIEVPGNYKAEESLKQILSLEAIELHPADAGEADFVIAADDEKLSGKIKITVRENSPVRNFSEAAEELLRRLRSSSAHRKTRETDIRIKVSLEGSGKADIKTGIGFFDHMLEQIARHGNIDLKISVKGDLHVDEHHSVEDVGITLGNALSEALGNKQGIKRYGYFLPMDDTAAQCAVDLGGRTYLNFKCKFSREKVGDFPTELTEEFFKGLSSGLKANIFIRAKGKNDHHKIEAIFKAFAKSLNEACRMDERSEGILPTTKGIL